MRRPPNSSRAWPSPLLSAPAPKGGPVALSPASSISFSLSPHEPRMVLSPSARAGLMCSCIHALALCPSCPITAGSGPSHPHEKKIFFRRDCPRSLVSQTDALGLPRAIFLLYLSIPQIFSAPAKIRSSHWSLAPVWLCTCFEQSLWPFYIASTVLFARVACQLSMTAVSIAVVVVSRVDDQGFPIRASKTVSMLSASVLFVGSMAEASLDSNMSRVPGFEVCHKDAKLRPLLRKRAV
ncbi:hypothetical protein IWX92DRAFT_363113 [Phyllosticta citricarpa]